MRAWAPYDRTDEMKYLPGTWIKKNLSLLLLLYFFVGDLTSNDYCSQNKRLWRAYSCPPTWWPKLLLLISCWTFNSYPQMCFKRYHITFSTFCLKFKCKSCVKKEVIHNFKNHTLVTWPATNLLILRKSCGFEKTNHYYMITIIWPSNHFWKAKSYSFHFHKNDVTWPLSANGL